MIAVTEDFTTEQLAAAAGIKVQTLLRWVAQGFLVPDRNLGAGRGNGHRWGRESALGVLACCALWKSPRGCRPSHFGTVVRAVLTRERGGRLRRYGALPGPLLPKDEPDLGKLAARLTAVGTHK